MRSTPRPYEMGVTIESADLDIFGVQEHPRKKRTSAEVAELKQRIGLIARVFARQYDLQVYPSPASRDGWACGIEPKYLKQLNDYMQGKINSLDALPPDALVPRSIYYSVKDVEGDKSDDEVLGVLRHEVGHANHTDYRLFFEGQHMAMSEGKMPSTYAWIFNCFEDPYVNNKEIADSDAVREKMRALYRGWIRDVHENINAQPLSHQIGLNIIHYWLTHEKIPGLKNQRAEEIVDQLLPFADAYFDAENAEESSRILREKIWPIYREIEEEAKQEEMQKQLMRDLAGNQFGNEPGGGQKQPGGRGEGSGGGSSGGEGEPSGSSLQSGGSGGLMQRLKKALGMGGDQQAGAGGGGKQSAPQQPNVPLEKRAPVGQHVDQQLKDEIKKELERQADAAKKRGEERNEKGEDPNSLPDDIDLNDLSDEVKKALQDAFDQLTPAEKDALGKKATEELDRKQAEGANKTLPTGIQMKKDADGTYKPQVNAPDEKASEKIKKQVDEFNEQQDAREAAEQKAAEERERQEQQRQAEERRRKQELEEMRAAGFAETELELYRAYRALEQSVSGYIENFSRIMDPYLPKKGRFEHSGEFYTGSRLNRRALVKRAPIGDDRFHERRELVESTDPRLFVELLIDNSGSMRGVKMQESLRTAIFLALVLKRFEIPCAIKFFGDQVVDIMNFDDDYGDSKKRIKPRLMKNGNASGMSTDMNTPLEMALKEMVAARRTYTGCHGAVFVISDSGANAGGRTGAALGAYIREMQKTFTAINFLLSGVSNDVHEAKQLFGEQSVVVAHDFSKLPQEAFQVLRLTMQRVIKTLGETQI